MGDYSIASDVCAFAPLPIELLWLKRSITLSIDEEEGPPRPHCRSPNQISLPRVQLEPSTGGAVQRCEGPHNLHSHVTCFALEHKREMTVMNRRFESPSRLAPYLPPRPPPRAQQRSQVGCFDGRGVLRVLLLSRTSTNTHAIGPASARGFTSMYVAGSSPPSFLTGTQETCHKRGKQKDRRDAGFEPTIPCTQSRYVTSTPIPHES